MGPITMQITLYHSPPPIKNETNHWGESYRDNPWTTLSKVGDGFWYLLSYWAYKIGTNPSPGTGRRPFAFNWVTKQEGLIASWAEALIWSQPKFWWSKNDPLPCGHGQYYINWKFWNWKVQSCGLQLGPQNSSLETLIIQLQIVWNVLICIIHIIFGKNDPPHRQEIQRDKKKQL